MNRAFATIVGVVVLGIAGWLMMRSDRPPEPAKPHTEQAEPPVARKAPEPDGTPAVPAAEAPEPTEKPSIGWKVPDREPPKTPEQEGLYALIDASGQALASCELASFPDGAALPTDHVVVDGQVYLPVEPTNVKETNDGSMVFEPSTIIQLDGDRSYSMTVSMALPGMAPGPCSIMPIDVSGMALDADDFADAIKQDASAELDDAADGMHPAQVALDTPGLSEGARAWLQDRLDSALDDAEDSEEATDLPERIEAAVGE